MENIWYKNPKVLLTNFDEFFPVNKFTRTQKINSIARFAIYYAILILVMKQDNKWLSLSLVLLMISYFLGSTEEFTIPDSSDPNVISTNCQKPTKQNPFMNYTFGDLVNNVNRGKACDYENIKIEMRKAFRSNLHTDTSDIWGRFITDRNYYTTPNTAIVNDQTGFAKWCFGNSGQCKSLGTNCLKERDPTYHRGRITNNDEQQTLDYQ